MTGANLPSRGGRWPSAVVKTDLAGQRFYFIVNFDPATFQPVAVFVHGGVYGSDAQLLVANIGIPLSLALQCGVTAEAMGRNLKEPEYLGREPGWTALLVPAIVGAIQAELAALRAALATAGLDPDAPRHPSLARHGLGLPLNPLPESAATGTAAGLTP